jgi:hypothetical protein
MTGLVQPKRLATVLGWLIVAPLIFCVVFGNLESLYVSLSPAEQMLALALLPIVMGFLLRFMFPKSVLVRTVSSLIFDLLVFVVTFPLRFLWRSIRLIAQRERQETHLAHTPVVVGQRPQLRQPHREVGLTGDDH